MNRVLFYAFGGGHGHLTRTAHIRTELLSKVELQTLVLGPPRTAPLPLGPNSTTPDIGREALGRWVTERIESFKPDLVVVDTFPRGILGELRLPAGIPSLLVTRWVNPAFYRSPGVHQAVSTYDQVCWVEPKSDPTFPGIRCEPVMAPETPLPREKARELLEADERPLVLGLGSGPTGQQIELARKLQALAQTHHWDARWLSPALGTGRPQLGKLLKGADLVLSAAGYNSYYELLRAGVPALLLPQERLVDDQLRRAQGHFGLPLPAARVVAPDSLATPALELLNAGPAPARETRGRQQVSEEVLRMLAPKQVTAL